MPDVEEIVFPAPDMNTCPKAAARPVPEVVSSNVLFPSVSSRPRRTGPTPDEPGPMIRMICVQPSTASIGKFTACRAPTPDPPSPYVPTGQNPDQQYKISDSSMLAC